MTIKYRVVLFAASAFCALSASLAAAQTELTVIVYGGSFEDGWRKSVLSRSKRQIRASR